MQPHRVDNRLGSQLWVERDDSAERIQDIVGRAASLGIGQVRIFLMWPWIQSQSQEQWEWGIWDEVFEACRNVGVTVKATLTSNSGPWWLGTPSVLHSATLTLDESWRGAQEAYIRAAVERYRDHPALGQWILWNEPGYSRDSEPAVSRPVGSQEMWQELLAKKYGDVGVLNRLWRTGYSDFADVPFQEDIVHSAHKDWYWHSWAPYRDDAALRARMIDAELAWVAKIVRQLDPATPLCVNPNKILNNHANSGIRLESMASLVDTMGASFHAPWVFTTFSEVEDHTPLVIQGLRLLQQTPGSHTCEVTEVQTGNTFYAGVHPIGLGYPEIAATYLAPLLAGGTSVTGWCFNTRSDDFEAGEWGLLNDDDSVSHRALALPHVRDSLAELDQRLGSWSASPPTVGVITSPNSHIHQYALSQNTHTPLGSNGEIGIQGSALAAIEIERLGHATTLVWPPSIHHAPLTALLALHQSALSDEEVTLLLECAKKGATVIIDATTAQFTENSVLHRPWPGVWARETGLVAEGLDTAREASGVFPVNALGREDGYLVGVRSRVRFSPEWVPNQRFTWADSGESVVVERPWGEGSLVYVLGALGLSLHHGGEPRRQASRLLAEVLNRFPVELRPLSPNTSIIKVRGEHDVAWGVFAPSSDRRGGLPVQVGIEPGNYRDVWAGEDIHVGSDRVARFDAPAGIVVLIPQ
jgi:hypothetical protein